MSPPATSDLRDDEALNLPSQQFPVEPVYGSTTEWAAAANLSGRAVPSDASLFGGTPYEAAPPEVREK